MSYSDPRDYASLLAWFPTSVTYALWLEDSSLVQLTRAAADGDTIGQVGDAGPYAHRLVATGSARRPALGSGSGRNSYLTFTGASSQYLIVENSLACFNAFHTGATAVSVCVWLKVATDGTDMVVFDSCNFTSSNRGWYLYRTSGNKVNFAISKAGGTRCSYTTTASLTVASGWTAVTVTVPAGSSTGTIQVGAAAAETFAVAAGTTGDAFATLTVGVTASAHTSAYNGSIADPVITASVMSGAELTAYRAYNPNRSGTSLAGPLAAGSSLTPDQVSHLHTWYDFSDAATLWQDAAKSSAVASDSDPIWTAATKWGAAAGLNRDAVTSASGHRPLYRTGVRNGRAAGLWDGVDDDLIFAQQWPSGGPWTAFAVCRMSASSVAAHLLSSAAANSYWVVTSSAYVTASQFLVHTTDGQAVTAPLVNIDSWNILEYVRDGPTLRLWVNGVEAPPLSSAAVAAMTNVGLANGGATSWNDYLGELVAYRAAHTEATRSAVRAALASKWGIANVSVSATGGLFRAPGMGGGISG